MGRRNSTERIIRKGRDAKATHAAVPATIAEVAMELSVHQEKIAYFKVAEKRMTQQHKAKAAIFDKLEPTLHDRFRSHHTAGELIDLFAEQYRKNGPRLINELINKLHKAVFRLEYSSEEYIKYFDGICNNLIMTGGTLSEETTRQMIESALLASKDPTFRTFVVAAQANTVPMKMVVFKEQLNKVDAERRSLLRTDKPAKRVYDQGSAYSALGESNGTRQKTKRQKAPTGKSNLGKNKGHHCNHCRKDGVTHNQKDCYGNPDYKGKVPEWFTRKIENAQGNVAQIGPESAMEEHCMVSQSSKSIVEEELIDYEDEDMDGLEYENTESKP